MTTCGDGIKAATEACDDGNVNDLDGCVSCSITPASPVSNCVVIGVKSYCDICGNSIRNTPEVCDDGNSTDGEGCSSDCMSVLSNWTCTGGSPSSKDICLPKYGDGQIVGSENCDDSNLISGDGCSPTG